MMKARNVLTAAVACLGCGFLIWPALAGSPVQSGSQAAQAIATAMPALSGEFSYVGSGKCKMCHMAVHKSWKKTKMARAFDILKPGTFAEAKTKHGLDVNKDYTKDATCLPCHTTGYGHASGYATPDPADKKAVRKAKKLIGVGCESCHGPGSSYVKLHKEIMDSKRKYTSAEMYAAGMTKIDASTCAVCHNDKGPTFDASISFDFEKKKDEDRHDSEELKQRE